MFSSANPNKAEPCPTCGGVGKVKDKFWDPGDLGLGWDMCGTCHGTGFTPPADTPAAEINPDGTHTIPPGKSNLTVGGVKVAEAYNSPQPEPTAESADRPFELVLLDAIKRTYYIAGDLPHPNQNWFMDWMRPVIASHKALIATAKAEGRREGEAKTLQDMIDWCNQMGRHDDMDDVTLRAVQIGCEKAIAALKGDTK